MKLRPEWLFVWTVARQDSHAPARKQERRDYQPRSEFSFYRKAATRPACWSVNLMQHPFPAREDGVDGAVHSG